MSSSYSCGINRHTVRCTGPLIRGLAM